MTKFNIKKLGACEDALHYYKNKESFEEAWNDCPRGDWMLWISKKLIVDEKILFKAKALCAKTVIHLMRDDRSKKAIKASLDYSEGKITMDELAAAAAPALAAAYAAAAADAAERDNQKQTADICRYLLTDIVFEKIKESLKSGWE